jgi:hypothetical protein
LVLVSCATTPEGDPPPESEAPPPPEPAPEPEGDPPPPALPPREPAAVQTALQANIENIQACYQAALAEQPDLNGKLKIRWKIAPRGTVESVETLEDSVGDEGVRLCVEEVIRGIAFAPAGTETVVGYPFVFAPAL